MQRNEITSQFPRYFLLVMSFGAKVTKVKKTTASRPLPDGRGECATQEKR